MTMKLSVNILSWNCAGVLKDTLAMLKDELKGIDHEIIVVDNGSTDGSADMSTIKNEKNMGVSIGKNKAIDISKGDYILLLDGDILPVENSIRLLLEYMDAHRDVYALGFLPNKWSNQKNKNGQVHHEKVCYKIYNISVHNQVIAFYGLFRREVFDVGIRFPVYGSFGECGYGWEDSDFYMQMAEKGFIQYSAEINSISGKYYHEINSSIRLMGHNEYVRTSQQRAQEFYEKWGRDNVRKVYKQSS
jgi:glycosyltransferase involved in cell wall biosynthesis